MEKNLSFSKASRLSGKEIRKFYSGRFCSFRDCLVIFSGKNGLERHRLAVTATRKFGKAVARNLAKRKIRECFRTHREKIKSSSPAGVPGGTGLDIIVKLDRPCSIAQIETVFRRFIDEN